MRLPLGDDVDAAGGERVLHGADRQLVAGDLLRRIDHAVAALQLEVLVAAAGDPAERGGGFTLRAGADDQQLARIEPRRGIERQHRREVFQIARRPRDAEDAVHRPPDDAHLPPGLERHLAERVEPRRIRREGRNEHTAGLARADDLEQSVAHPRFGAARLGVEHVGRIADHRQHALVADRLHLRRSRRRPHLRLVVELPVAGVEDAAERRVDDETVPFGNRVRHRGVAELEVAERQRPAHRDDVELDLLVDALLDQLAADEAGGERRRVQRHAEVGGEIGDRADMVLVAMRQDDAEQVVAPLLDERQVGQDQVDAGVRRIGEGHAEVDHHPLAAAAVEVDVHADLTRPAKGQEDQFVAGGEEVLAVLISHYAPDWLRT